MTTLDFDSFEGLYPAARRAIYECARELPNWQRLTICMLFMSDLPLETKHLEDIERALREIFPPAIRSKLAPQDYQDFAASTIRFYFNSETRAVRNGEISASERLWENLKRGYWRNTKL